MIVDNRKIVFDICDVLVSTSYKNVSEYFFDKKNLFSKDYQYYQYSIGKITTYTYFKHFCEKYCLDISYNDFVKGWNKLFVREISGIHDLLNDLRVKYDLMIMSNINELHAKYFIRRYKKISSCFTKYLFSCRIGLRKPNGSIYNSLISLSNFKNPNDFIFIDDKVQNIEAAQKYGIEGIVFKNTKRLRKSLANIGIL